MTPVTKPTKSPPFWKDWARFALLFFGSSLVANGVVKSAEESDWSWWATLFFVLGAICLSAFNSWRVA